MQVVTVNKHTGEIEANCAICGYGVSSDIYEYADGVHVMIEVSDEENSAIIESIKEKPDGNPELTMKLNMKKAKTYLRDRKKVDSPIEAELYGGREIIGYEKKPERIVIVKKNK